jgi:hypothetical protein
MTDYVNTSVAMNHTYVEGEDYAAMATSLNLALLPVKVDGPSKMKQLLRLHSENGRGKKPCLKDHMKERTRKGK